MVVETLEVGSKVWKFEISAILSGMTAQDFHHTGAVIKETFPPKLLLQIISSIPICYKLADALQNVFFETSSNF